MSENFQPLITPVRVKTYAEILESNLNNVQNTLSNLENNISNIPNTYVSYDALLNGVNCNEISCQAESYENYLSRMMPYQLYTTNSANTGLRYTQIEDNYIKLQNKISDNNYQEIILNSANFGGTATISVTQAPNPLITEDNPRTFATTIIRPSEIQLQDNSDGNSAFVTMTSECKFRNFTDFWPNPQKWVTFNIGGNLMYMPLYQLMVHED